MVKLCRIVLLAAVLCTACKRHSTSVYVEDFRSPFRTDDEVIQAAINKASRGAVVEFEPSRTYMIQNVIRVKPFQQLRGNNATLRRANETFTTLSAPVNEKDSILTVDDIPKGWKVGDQIQVFTDSAAYHSNSFGDFPHLPNIIIDIDGHTISLSSQVGRAQGGDIITWPKGSFVRKVYSILRGDSINYKSVPFAVEDMNFDGNRDNNYRNFYWNVNSTIFMRGLGGRIENCRFRDIPNENIVGQGFFVSNCQAYGLNGSFVHMAGSDSVKNYIQRHAIVNGNTVIGVCQVPADVNGHNEGAFTASHNGGYITISNNRVYDCGQAAFGRIDSHYSVEDGGKSDVVITGNIFKNCKLIFRVIQFADPQSTMPQNIYVEGNTFSNCGHNDWTGESNWGTLHSGITMGPNNYTNGTVWIIKTKPDSSQPAVLQPQ